jgi:hypothetical protein
MRIKRFLENHKKFDEKLLDKLEKKLYGKFLNHQNKEIKFLKNG